MCHPNVVEKFKKKPVTIEAARLTGYGHIDIEVFHWVAGHVGIVDYDKLEKHKQGVSLDPKNGDLLIASLEGWMRATPGDWVIRGVMGEFYPCKPHIFASTYEPVLD